MDVKRDRSSRDVGHEGSVISATKSTKNEFEETRNTAADWEALPIDELAEKALLRKLDRWIVPPVMLLYLLSFLDRVNIGNARLYGLEEDLGLEGNQFQVAVSVLFVTYIFSETPSNLVIKYFTPSRYLAFLTYALRIGYLFVSAAIAGSMGGLLAYCIGLMDGVAGLRAWRWIIIIEGIPTVILGVTIWWWLADTPDTAHYLSTAEKDLIDARLRRQVGHTKSGDEFHKEDAIAGFKDLKIWLFCLGQFGGDVILYGYSTFLPTIISGLGDWDRQQVQALTIPCYATGAITYLVVAWLSDRMQRRAMFAVVSGLVCTVGYAILVSNASGRAKYFGCFVGAMGLYVVVGIPLAWLPSNNPRYGKRTVASGLQLAIGNSAGIPAPFLYATSNSPRFIKGHAISMAFVCMSSVIYMSFWAYFRFLNKKRDERKGDEKKVP
ncbi:hypothetical protein BN1708_016377 [Verticillium longisporum]|uniref:Major facilitator superfamily (MFS) profile domain-containing protein n=1 Tax=Verticillium longisporum TaxID=100787 RepID=A0A0G4MLH1_VERLO|nr:hypothetical protein BN1708_016377 [Verticillium longisporum]